MKTDKQSDFSQLKRKVFLQSLGMVAVATLFVGAIYILVWQGRGGDWLVNMLQNVFHMEEVTALSIYYRVFQRNSSLFVLLSVAVAFFTLFYFFLTRFTRYFNEVNQGINTLVNENAEPIHLSPELSAVEEKLNTVHQTLNDREIALKQEEQRKNDLVMYLAHDIKTPLTSVIGYLNLLDEAADMPAEQKAKYVHITLEKAYRLESLVNEFFEITRYNLQQITLKKEKIDLYYMMVQMIDEFYPVFSAKGIQAELQMAESLEVYGDSDKLARVFTNLLKNAAAYSYPDTSIHITAEEKDKTVRISIQNEGQTIPAQDLQAIFGKFYRLDESRSTNSGGAGLGLSIANEIILLHGGTIKAQSQQSKTVFTITLPLDVHDKSFPS